MTTSPQEQLDLDAMKEKRADELLAMLESMDMYDRMDATSTPSSKHTFANIPTEHNRAG